MATTTNFGWTTPNDTDLVKDGAAAIRTLGQSIDTSLVDLKGGTTGQVLAKASNTDMDFVWSADAAGMTNPMTTTGDTIYSSSGSTPARLAIGSTGNVLTVAGGVPTWAAPAGGGKNFTLLNTGGTALTGASTVTVSGISGKDTILVIVTNVRSGVENVNINARLNTDSSAKYSYSGQQITVGASFATSILNGFVGIDDTSFRLGTTSASVDSTIQASFLIQGANSTGIKSLDVTSGASAQGSNGHKGYTYKGIYTGTSTISSISIVAQAGNLDGSGMVYVYTSAS